MEIIYNKIAFNIDENGHLIDPSEFCREGIYYNCSKERIKLNDIQGEILEAAHKYYTENSKEPTVRALYKITGYKASEIYTSFKGGLDQILLLIGL